MTEPYKTLKDTGDSRYEEKKSVFLGYTTPLHDDAEAQAFLTRIREKHPDARHRVYAYLLRNSHIMRYSDDGEPQGTAGVPVLDCLRKQEITDAGIVVVRYFGGTLLGTGGLVRAYTAAAQAAVASAGVVSLHPYTVCAVKAGYADYQRLLPLLDAMGAIVDDTEFSLEVTVCLAVESTRLSVLTAKVADVSCGRATLTVTGERFDGR